MTKVLTILTLLLGLFTIRANATVIYVDSSHVGGTQNGTSWATAFSNFQSGINAANAGDSVWVAKGIYQPASGMSFSMKDSVMIFGGFLNTNTTFTDRNIQNNTTTLKGNNNSVILNESNIAMWSDRAVLNGFTITEGNAIKGGGMYNSNASPVISDCRFEFNNATENGGAMYNEQGTPSIINCIFSDNMATNYQADGGGIYNAASYLTIISCMFSNNVTINGRGGAIFNAHNGSLNAINTTFSFNSAIIGGAICMDFSASGTITACSFVENSAISYEGRGGAIVSIGILSITESIFTNNNAVSMAGAILSNGGYNISKCFFGNNTVTGQGGALYSVSGSNFQKISNCKFSANHAANGAAIYYSNVDMPLIINTLFYKNQSDSSGSCIFNDNSFPKIINCTLVGNKSGNNGGAVRNTDLSTSDITNTIIWGNNNSGISNDQGATASIKYSLIQGMAFNSINHNIDGSQNPDFIDTASQDYQLSPTSLCINAGLNEPTTGYYQDILGNDRIYDSIVDLGCYEFYVPSVDLGNDSTICNNDSLNLNARNGGSTYLWSTGDTTQNIWVHTDGTYYVTATNAGGVATDTIILTTSPFLNVNLGPDTFLTEVGYIQLNAGYPGSSYLWNTGDTSQGIVVESAGTYSVTVTNNAGCTGTDTIIIAINPLGINNVHQTKYSVAIYPNPTKEIITINITDPKLLLTNAILTDAYGRVVRIVMIESKSQPLSLRGLSSGIYILKMKNGTAVKIVKEQ